MTMSIIPDLTVADWLQVTYLCITLLGIIVAGYVSVWIVNSLQQKIDNEKFLKEHFCNEIIAVRDNYRLFIADFMLGKLHPVEIKSLLSNYQNSCGYVMSSINKAFGIDRKAVNKHVLSIAKTIIDDELYGNAYKENKVFTPDEDLAAKVIETVKKIENAFNDLIISIYRK